MLKKLSVFAIALLLIGGSAMAFAWWDRLSVEEEEIISIGAGVTLEVDAVAGVPEGKFLVPAGVILKTDDVNEIVLTYNVKLDTELPDALDLAVTESNVEIGGDDTYAGLVNIDISLAEAEVNNADVLVTVTVTLTEPADEATYDAIKNQDITFTLTFTASE